MKEVPGNGSKHQKRAWMYTWTYYLSKTDLRNCASGIDLFNKVITEGDKTDPDVLK